MDDLLFVRLQAFIVGKLKADISTFTADNNSLADVVISVMEFVENKIAGIDASGMEKSFLALNWIKKLFPNISENELNIIRQFMSGICSAASGMFDINVPKPAVVPVVPAVPVAKTPSRTLSLRSVKPKCLQ